MASKKEIAITGPPIALGPNDVLELDNKTKKPQLMGNRNFSTAVQPGDSVIILHKGYYEQLRNDAYAMRYLRSWGPKERVKWARWPKRFNKYTLNFNYDGGECQLCQL